ncbi:MAG: transmembrane ion channel [Candidatus Cloacimonadota bacterium]|nr:MAG: transmembrane ion channel [Candidatus Cloacimonadota bacterium]
MGKEVVSDSLLKAKEVAGEEITGYIEKFLGKIPNKIEIVSAVASVLIITAVIYGINRLFKAVYKKLKDISKTKIKTVKIKDYDILPAKYTYKIFITVFKILRVLLLSVIIYFWMSFLFGIFPATKNISNILIGYVTDPLKSVLDSFINFLPGLFFIFIVLIIVRYINKGLVFFADDISKERLKIDGFYKEWAKPTYLIIKIIIYVFALVIIFPYLPGSNSPAFQGVSIFMGVLLSLGSTDFIANAVGGLMMIYMRPFIVGDVVKIGGTMGTVVHKGMLVTRLKTPKNEEISLPNKLVTQNQIVNYSSEGTDGGFYMHTTVTIGYDVEWRKVHKLMIEAASRTKDIMKAPKPFVLQTELNDFSVAYELNAYCKNPSKMGHVYSLLHQNLQDCFNESGIEILSPHYHVKRVIDGQTIPDIYKKRD